MRLNRKIPHSLKGRRAKHRFPVDPETLLACMDEHHLTQILSVSYRLRTSRAVLVSARYYGEINRDRMKEYGLGETSHAGVSEVRVYSVSPEDEDIAREAITKEALPVLCEWLREAEQQSYNWRRVDHNIIFRFKKARLLMDLDQSWYY